MTTSIVPATDGRTEELAAGDRVVIVDALYRRAREGGVAIANEIADRDYGLRDFIIEDPDGFRLRFASPTS